MTEHGERWFEQHMEEFVKPVLGSIPNPNPKNPYVKQFTTKHLLALRGLWVQAKRRANGRTILLPGRDVFLFEILARLEGYSTIFRPDISSSVAPHVSDMDKATYKDLFCIDTGFRGSVPKALGVTDWALIKFRPQVTGTGVVAGTKEYKEQFNAELNSHQLFPRMREYGPIGNLSYDLEAVPKYWQRAEWQGIGAAAHIVQERSPLETFKYAAEVTLHIVGRPYTARSTSVYAAALREAYFDWLPRSMKQALKEKPGEDLHSGRRDRNQSQGDCRHAEAPRSDFDNLGIPRHRLVQATV